MISIGVSTIHHYLKNTMKIECGCHCIKCKSTDLESNQIGQTEKDGILICITHVINVKHILII